MSYYPRLSAARVPPFRPAPFAQGAAAREARLRGSARMSWLVRECRPGESREDCLARFDLFYASLNRPA